MTRHKTEDAAKFAKMVGGNMRFLRLNHTPFRPQKVLAHHLGLTFQQVQKYESGKNTFPVLEERKILFPF